MDQMTSLPEREMERLLAVRSLMSFKNGPSPELEALSELARGVFSVSRASVHLMDDDWLYIVEQAGMQLSECPRDISICNRVLAKQDVVVIPDLTEHPDFSLMPYVQEGPKLRSYAGAPIELEPGLIVGAFCVVDTAPRNFSAAEIDNLQRFAVLATALLRLQQANFTMSLAERELRNAAMTDPLTGFYNRKALDVVVDLQLAVALNENETFGALYLDMDGFKSINDTFGHSVGDCVLAAAADRIRAVTGSEDIIVRMGGDEFAIFVPRPEGSETLRVLADRLLCAFREPFEVEGRQVVSRLSIGGAIAPQAGADCATLLSNVDSALYQAKKAGRDRYVSRAL